MDRARFESLVARAVEGLPDQFLERLDNVAVVVDEYPTQAQLSKAGLKRGQTLLGLYEGIPQTKRGGYYNLAPPDKITIFQGPIESICRDDAGITAEVQSVVRHEIAHHFGTDEATLGKMEREKGRRRREV